MGGRLTHLSLFSGIGGLDLAAEWAGFETVGQCEIRDYQTMVLEKHWSNVPKWRDVKDVTGDELARQSIAKVTCISGGFPCQPHSLAGKRLASLDERDLWGEFARIVREVRPKWVVGENVYGLLSSEHGRFFGRILRDMAGMGYRVGWGSFGAFNAGATHRRKRVFIIAYSGDLRFDCLDENKQKRCPNMHIPDYEKIKPVEVHELFANAQRILSNPSSRIRRNDDGVPEALDRLECLGGAVMPWQAYPIFASIAEIERSSQ